VRSASAAPTAIDVGGVRAVNLARVTRAVLGTEPSPTRAEVATTTSMTRATVSRLVEDLVAGELLTELDQVADGRRGRPGTPLGPSTDRFVALGLQVNVGSLTALAVDLSGSVIAERSIQRDLHGSRPRTVLARLARLVRQVLDELPAGRSVVGAGLALPGIVSTGSGTLLRAPNLGWSDVVVPDLLDPAALDGAPLTIGNEADLASATVSLDRPGRASALTDFVYLSGEIGIGGAIVIDGRPMPGRHGWAGEIGHVTVDPSGPPCVCGSTGCLEMYAGRQAVLDAAGLAPGSATTELVAQVRAGDPDASAAVHRAAWALGMALAGVVNVVDVPVIVLGGHLRELTDLVRPGIEQVLTRRVLSADWAPPAVRAAAAHPAPGALGAAYRELERVVHDPAAWLSPAAARRSS
jgi:predicted NBD/HSP70 family sugar kinase